MASDQVVTSQDVLQALLELRRLGNQQVLASLEKLEPDLAEYLMEELGQIHQLLLKTGSPPKPVRRLLHRIESLGLILVASLRRGHARLWTAEVAHSRLAQLDPFLDPLQGPHDQQQNEDNETPPAV